MEDCERDDGTFSIEMLKVFATTNAWRKEVSLPIFYDAAVDSWLKLKQHLE